MRESIPGASVREPAHLALTIVRYLTDTNMSRDIILVGSK